MLGRMDLTTKTCRVCKGTGRDPNKRARACPRCSGHGAEPYCTSCSNYMPCPGTDRNIMDQSYCRLPAEQGD